MSNHRTMPKHRGRQLPGVEGLESRQLLAGNVIAGTVYNDLNRDGLLGPGEVGIAGAPVNLADSTGRILATTTTDASGNYRFDRSTNLGGQAATISHAFTFPDMTTDWTKIGTVPQFDPSLGTLTSVDILNAGTLVSRIKVENTGESAAVVTAQTSGALTLTVPGTGSTLVASPSDQQTFNATGFDGVIDFGGSSGFDFGANRQTATKSATLTPPSSDLSPYIGTGTVSFTESAHSTSAVTGPGNVVQSIDTSASGTVTFVYHYTTIGTLPPGQYIVSQPSEPPGFSDFLESQNGAVIPNSIGTDSIPVTLNGADSVHNNFGELREASLSGFVYYDHNNDGIRQLNEFGIANVTINLTGTDDQGRAVSRSILTASDGSYRFANLAPGTYSIKEVQPKPFRDGKDRVGSQGGQMTNDHLFAISLQAGQNGVENNFGELAKPGCKLPGLTMYHTTPGHQLPGSSIGPRVRFYLPTLVPLITRRPRP